MYREDFLHWDSLNVSITLEFLLKQLSNKCNSQRAAHTYEDIFIWAAS